jgi:hypothetical protein
MVNYLISIMKSYHAKPVNAAQKNRLESGKKPDIFVTIKGEKYYLDVGFSVDPKAYYTHKINKYQ